MSTSSQAPRRPRCLTKYDLITYFKVSYRVLWRRVITDDLLEGWGFTYVEDVKPTKTLSPILSDLIYTHFSITDLDAANTAPEEETRSGHRAPEDI
jgi:hypothetical protein